MWTLNDLRGTTQRIMMCKDALDQHGAAPVGMCVAILNPMVLRNNVWWALCSMASF